MQVILIQDVNNLGGVNELVTVKNGYGRNFLIPCKLAVEASPGNLKQREEKEPGVVLTMDYAFIYAGLKDFDKAFHYLHKTYEQRIGIACLGMIFCVRSPILTGLKADPRFLEITRKMGIEK